MQPPQNPYEQPNPYSPPNPYGAPTGQPPRGRVSLEVIGEAWKLVMANIGGWILFDIVLFAVSFGIGIAINIIQMPFALMGASSRTPGTFPPGLIVGMLIAYIVSFIANTWLSGGVLRVIIESVRTGQVEIGKLFSAGDVLGKLLVGSLLCGVIFGVLCIPAFLVMGKSYLALLSSPATFAAPGARPDFGPFLLGWLLMIPAGVICLGFYMTLPLIVDKGMAPVEALATSWNTLKSQLLMLFLYGIVIYLVNIVGFFACCVGLLITIPLTLVSFALIYRDMFGIGPTLQNTPFGGAPISDPRF